jgi:hypothetical protein
MDFGYPLKLHEYFAAGLPVVSTPLPSIREFDRFLDLATTSEEWQAAIGRCLRQGKTAQKVHELREVARRNNWDLRVANLQDLLLSALQGAGSPLPVPAASAP